MNLTQWPRLSFPIRILAGTSTAALFIFLTLSLKTTNHPTITGAQMKGIPTGSPVRAGVGRDEEGSIKTNALSLTNGNTEILNPALVERNGRISTNRKLIILLTTMRSGSTFFASMFDQSDETLLIFEPFFLLESFGSGVKTNYTFVNTDEMKLEILLSIATCRFDIGPMAEIMRVQSQSKPTPRKFSRTLVEPPLCPNDVPPRECPPINCQMLNRVCLSKTATVIKLIRMYDINLLKKFQEKLESDDKTRMPAEWHVIHLVRDPRGTMNSRIAFGHEVLQIRYQSFHNDSHYRSMEELVRADARKMCNEMLSHIQVASKESDWIRGHYMRVRFEDVAMNASLHMERLFGLYGLEVTGKLRQWIHENTNGRGADGYMYGTVRKSELVPMKWKRMLEKDETRKLLEVVETECKEVMSMLQYEIFFHKTY